MELIVVRPLYGAASLQLADYTALHCTDLCTARRRVMSEVEAANAAALKIQSRYKAYRTRRAIDGMALSKADWQTVLNQVDILLRSSQFKEAQPKELSVRGKWIRCLGSAGAIGRVSARFPDPASCLHLQHMCRLEVCLLPARQQT